MRGIDMRAALVGLFLTLCAESSGAIDRSCDLAPYPSLQWTACEAANFA